jgi:hypothetical protein
LRTQEKSSNLANSSFFRKVREQFGWRTVRHTSRHNHNKFEIILFCLFHNIRSLVDAPSFGRPGRRRACNIFKENQQLQTSCARARSFPSILIYPLCLTLTDSARRTVTNKIEGKLPKTCTKDVLLCITMSGSEIQRP